MIVLGALVATLAVLYLFGVGASFQVGYLWKDDYKIALDVYGRDAKHGSRWAIKKIRDAEGSYRQGRRRQVRSFIWPIDAYRWLKHEIVQSITETYIKEDDDD